MCLGWFDNGGMRTKRAGDDLRRRLPSVSLFGGEGEAILLFWPGFHFLHEVACCRRFSQALMDACVF